MKIYFENMDNGWVDFRLEVYDLNIIYEGFSYTPYDSFLELAGALFDIKKHEGSVSKQVIFNTEPYEYEFRFKKENERVSLKIVGFPDYRRPSSSESIFNIEGSYQEICLPFWRGLRRLQGRYSAEELDERWHRPFPSKDIDILTKLLKDMST